MRSGALAGILRAFANDGVSRTPTRRESCPSFGRASERGVKGVAYVASRRSEFLVQFRPVK